MPTPAHTDFDNVNPQSSQTPAAFATSNMADLKALRDAILDGRIEGFVQTRTNGTGTANQPQFVTWLNAALQIGFRWNLTWTGFQPTTITDEWSNDNGGTWTPINANAAQVNTFDGSNNLTASTNAGGMRNVLLEVWTKCLKIVSDFATHIAATGTAVHGLGTAAVANLTAMVIGGTSSFDGTGGVGQSARGPVDAKRIREEFRDYGAIAAAGTVTLEMDKFGGFAFTPSATTTDTVTVATSGAGISGLLQSFVLEINNGQRSADGKITWPASAKWVGGAAARPLDTSLRASGKDLFAFYSRDAGARLEIQYLGAAG